MSNLSSSTKTKKTFTHLNITDRKRSTITREIKRGTTIQLKYINGLLEEVEVYLADTGQVTYDKNRKKSQSKGLEAFSDAFWQALSKQMTKEYL